MRFFAVFAPIACAEAPPTFAPDGALVHDAGFADAAALDAAAPDAAVPALTFLSDGVATSTIVYGAPASVRAAGLEPGARYTLRATLWGYVSETVFAAANDGTIDTTRDAPESGDYDGVEPEGFVWSMIKRSEDTAPHYDVTVTIHRDRAELLRATLHRAPMGADATWTRVRDNGLVATLVVPNRAEPPPVVIVLGGSEGGIRSAEFEAAYLSTFGVAALALGYFGVENLPPRLERVPLEYVHGAVDWLQTRTDVDASRIILSGGSRGSELALMVAATSTPVRGVIALVPSSVRWASVERDDVPAWTYRGVDLPYVRSGTTAMPEVEDIDGVRGYRFTPMFDAILDRASPQDLEAARIRVEDIEAPVLLLGSEDDALWPSCRFAEHAMQALRATAHDGRYADQQRCFEDAGHLLGPAGWPTRESYASYDPFLRGYLVLGGTAKGTARAQRELYRIYKAFFEAL